MDPILNKGLGGCKRQSIGSKPSDGAPAKSCFMASCQILH